MRIHFSELPNMFPTVAGLRLLTRIIGVSKLAVVLAAPLLIVGCGRTIKAQLIQSYNP